jgi:hypothetical protein
MKRKDDVMSQRARVSVIDHNSGKKYTVQVPTNVTTAQLLPYLVRDLKLPAEGPGGASMNYSLTLETGEDGRVRLDENEILAEVGVQDGAILRITPDMRAGIREIDDALL